MCPLVVVVVVQYLGVLLQTLAATSNLPGILALQADCERNMVEIYDQTICYTCGLLSTDEQKIHQRLFAVNPTSVAQKGAENKAN